MSLIYYLTHCVVCSGLKIEGEYKNMQLLIRHSMKQLHQLICDNICGDNNYNALHAAEESCNIMDTTVEHTLISGINYSC